MRSLREYPAMAPTAARRPRGPRVNESTCCPTTLRVLRATSAKTTTTLHDRGIVLLLPRSAALTALPASPSVSAPLGARGRPPPRIRRGPLTPARRDAGETL